MDLRPKALLRRTSGRAEPVRLQVPEDDPRFMAELHRLIIERLEDDETSLDAGTAVLRQRLQLMVEDHLERQGFDTTRADLERLTRELLQELTGFGPLEPLLADDAITDILVNGPEQVFVEMEGRLRRVPVRFVNDGHILRVVRRMLAPLGKRLDEASPMVDARLPDGSRVNAIVPPLALDGPCLSIRKFRREALTGEDLVAGGAMPASLLETLRQAVISRRNILISGGTGAGKTTLLNVLSSAIPEGERVVTIEDSAELQLHNHHVVRLETRPANLEGQGEVTPRQLIRNALRMRPDRIILGESRGEEVLDVLQAMNTGHMGSMSTVHANSAQDALVRLQMMVRLARFQGTDRLISQIIASALDLIIQIERGPDGHRFVSEVLRVERAEQDQIRLESLYVAAPGAGPAVARAGCAS